MRSSRWVVLGLALGGGSPNLAGEEGKELRPAQVFSVRVGNYAGVRSEVLAAAERVAQEVLGRAGVAIEWRECTPVGGRLPPDRQGDLVLELLGRHHSRALAPSPDVLAVALLPRHPGERLYAAVFLGNVEALSRSAAVPTSLVLGHAVAHEIGHLLLGTREHAAAGLMLAQWSPAAMSRAAWGQLRFTAEEAARLRTAVASDRQFEGALRSDGPVALRR